MSSRIYALLFHLVDHVDGQVWVHIHLISDASSVGIIVDAHRGHRSTVQIAAVNVFTAIMITIQILAQLREMIPTTIVVRLIF